MNKNPKVLVGLEFGTSEIGCAYAFFGDKIKIYVPSFSDQYLGNKVPAEIILDTNLKDVLAFGKECREFISSHHKQKNEYENFKQIKINLYNRNYIIKSKNDRETNIQLIITKILQEISKKVIEQINIRHNKIIKREDIKWVIPIPGIWEEKAKEIMINASLSAGLIDNNTDLSQFLALEPVVSTIHYNSSDSCFNKTFNKGNPYIICVIGGETFDIYTYKNKKKSNNQIEFIEEYQPLGGNYGENYINKEFINRLIVEIFGEQKINDIKENAGEDWNKFENEIERLKNFLDASFLVENINFKLDCRLFENDSDKSLEDYIYDYNKKNLKYKYEIKKSLNKRNKWELLIPNKIFFDIIQEISIKIFSVIEEIYNNIPTGVILLDGGYKNINNITNFLDAFSKEKKMDISIYIPGRPELSIAYGAVLFGFGNYLINKRKVQFTNLSKWYSY